MRPDSPPLLALLQRAGLAHHAAAVAPFARPEIAIAARASPLDAIAPGASRFGGAPDLPPNTPWPDIRWTTAETAAWPPYALAELAEAKAAGYVTETIGPNGEALISLPLPFIAQLELERLSLIAPAAGLPARGALLFFASQSTQIAGPLPHANIASVVLYTAVAPRDRIRTPPPAMPEHELLAPAELSFEPAAVLDEQEIDAAALGISGDDASRLAELLRAPWSAPRHACLHAPDAGAAGVMPPDGWTSLLRVGSDDSLGMSWGDAAWVDFCIPDDALRAGRWQACRAAVWLG